MSDAPVAGQLIRDERTKQSLSLEDLAQKCKSSASYLSLVERGVVSPSERTLARIAKALGHKVLLSLVKREKGEKKARRKKGA